MALAACAGLELERDRSVVEVVLIAYGCALGVFGDGLDECREGELGNMAVAAMIPRC
jgi:hypothetical protein